MVNKLYAKLREVPSVLIARTILALKHDQIVHAATVSTANPAICRRFDRIHRAAIAQSRPAASLSPGDGAAGA
jgi:hypothetical protein